MDCNCLDIPHSPSTPTPSSAPALPSATSTLTVCTDGTYLLDGGAMFGVVPKTLWQKRIAANADNQILLGLNSVVVRTRFAHRRHRNRRRQQADAQDARDLRQPGVAAPSYAAAGLDPAEVDIVINTHLHFDHCGWNTTLHPDGCVTPTFPNARYFAHAGEVAHGHLQLDRDKVSYLSPNYDPLIASGQMTLLDLARPRRDGRNLPRHLGRTASPATPRT